MSEWVRAMGVDYGTARIGLAVSDDIGMLAHPLETVPASDPDKAARRIAELVVLRKTQHLIIGLPLHMDGGEGAAVERVRRFMQRLRPLLVNDVAIYEVDETLTTARAMEKLHAAGRNAKNSRKIIDQAAAIEILQGWLDRRANRDGPF
ncbi:MAG: Holliday junction resolvase RuvX [Verrucomicrobiales bacterium]|jgi:putative Holliday junction resolvase|nr:Holliday junction resolvase RuvX [Verrucomicrobiales bacterium]MBP9224860.1 Holliday junction resolvase RuvX [Verrucomicrobiales bacterium]HQZ28043.1 Holliday junction resolvase RuvX [Verrucomicrobiales bacterium]